MRDKLLLLCDLLPIGRNMIGQGKISNFFSPMGVKRTLSEDQLKKQSALKKLKTSEPEKGKAQNEPQLTEDQYKKIAENRMRAIIKRHAKGTSALSNNIGISWYDALKPEFSKPYFIKLSEFLTKERKINTIYPPVDSVYTWTTLCPIEEVKVVMLGQDPYHNPGQAHGLCFSVQDGISFPPSLVNIFKEMKSDLDDFEIPKSGDLSKWAAQGVLLLNACLTVKAHNANSHKDQGWELFTDAVIKWVNDNLSNVVFLLWGAYAQKKGSFINQKRHHILKCAHPSPLSVHRGFYGCKHFSKTNELLTKHGMKPIDWNL